jgi:hypothetical protein
MRDALVHHVPGARALLALILSVRINRRTRRSLENINAAFALTARPRWVAQYSMLLWNLYRLMLKHDVLFSAVFKCLFFQYF